MVSKTQKQLQQKIKRWNDQVVPKFLISTAVTSFSFPLEPSEAKSFSVLPQYTFPAAEPLLLPISFRPFSPFIASHSRTQLNSDAGTLIAIDMYHVCRIPKQQPPHNPQI